MSDLLGPVVSLTNADADIRNEAQELVGLPPPEQALQGITSRPPYGRIAVGAMKRLDQLLRCPDLAEQLPALSMALGEQALGPSSEVAYKTLLVSLAYYSVYCIERLNSEDGDSLTDALGLAMRPSMFAVDTSSSLFPFAQGARHAITVCAGAYWLRSLSGPPSLSPVQYHFLRPVSRSASVLLSLAGLPDPILDWGIAALSRFVGRMLFECTGTMELDILGYAQVGQHVNTTQLVRLARRDPRLYESLGARLYTEFERQLKSLFQSFGYFVSHTRPGKRRVDLVIATPPPCPYVFLVEAKSCRSSYSLPVADERALQEYVSVYRQSTHTLPQLRFVIITSSKAARTLEGKLTRLASSEGVPVRFVPAQELAYLRTHLPGPLQPKLLLDSIISAEPILGREWATGILDNTQHREQIFDVAVQSVFGEAPSRLPWYSSDEGVATR